MRTVILHFAVANLESDFGKLYCFCRERKLRERRDAKKKQEQEAVENKLRRIQLRESTHALKSECECNGAIYSEKPLKISFSRQQSQSAK